MTCERQVADQSLDEFRTIVQTKKRSKSCPRTHAWTISADIEFKKYFPNKYDNK